MEAIHIAVREKTEHHFEFYQRDVTDGTRVRTLVCPVDAVSERFHE